MVVSRSAGDGEDRGLRLDLHLEEPGQHAVDVPIMCVLTRFRLRSPFQLLPTYLDYRRVVRDAARAGTPGLLRSAFLIEDLTTCYSLSIWASHDAIPHFGTKVIRHVEVGRRIFGRLSFRKDHGPEIWSTKWRLAYVSNNLNWDDFDLRSLILRMSD